MNSKQKNLWWIRLSINREASTFDSAVIKPWHILGLYVLMQLVQNNLYEPWWYKRVLVVFAVLT